MSLFTERVLVESDKMRKMGNYLYVNKDSCVVKILLDVLSLQYKIQNLPGKHGEEVGENFEISKSTIRFAPVNATSDFID